jgi:hypothetical protein
MRQRRHHPLDVQRTNGGVFRHAPSGPAAASEQVQVQLERW